MWTQFYDMHSGGGLKESPYARIYIEAPEAEASVIFYNRFHHSPYRVSCTCCGEDYSVSESETLEQASAPERNCKWSDAEKKWLEEEDKSRSWAKYLPLAEYLKQDDALCIYAKDITSTDRIGSVPQQGYVWMD